MPFSLNIGLVTKKIIYYVSYEVDFFMFYSPTLPLSGNAMKKHQLGLGFYYVMKIVLASHLKGLSIKRMDHTSISISATHCE